MTHEMFVTQTGGSACIPEVIKLREEINELPKTSATFRLKQFDDVQKNVISDQHIEFLKSWPVPGSSGQHRATLYVNPNYHHAESMSDIITECECGTSFVYYRDEGNNRIDNAHRHADDCLQFMRLRARANLLEMRYHKTKELLRQGWQTREIAQRLGIEQGQLVNLHQRWDFDVRELQNEYRINAAETYKTLVHEHGVSAAQVAELYGVTPSAVQTWQRRFDNRITV